MAPSPCSLRVPVLIKTVGAQRASTYTYINDQASERAKATTSEVDALLHIAGRCQP